MRKTIQITLQITSGATDYENCEFIEQMLMNSSLNNSVFSVSVDEVKVVERKEETV